MKFKIIPTLFCVVATIALTACGTPTPAPAQPAPAPTPAAPAKPTSNKTTVYMVTLNATGDKGTVVGCGDVVVPIEVASKSAYDPTDPIASINAAMLALTSTTKDQFKAQNAVNTLSTEAALTIQSVDGPTGATSTPTSTKNKDKNYVVHLNGTFTFGGVCDMPRVRGQVEETIKQAALGNNYTIDFNGGGQTAWEKAFSLK